MRFSSFDVGIKNLAFCIASHYNNNTCIEHWNCVDLKTSSKDDLYVQLILTLDKYPELLQSETILIEKQPSRNNKMRIIEALLHSYFIIKGVLVSDNPVKKVIIYSSKHKLGFTNLRGKSNYSERKKLAVTRCKEFLTRSGQAQEFVEQFKKSSKKDDLADSCLQILSYVSNPCLKDIQNCTLDTCVRIIARKPTQLQERKLYSKSNLKHFFQSCDYNFITSLHDNNPKIRKAVNHWYPIEGIEQAFRELCVA